MEKIFEKKVALVTGASFGIGQATAVAFAKRGAKVVVADWIEDKEEQTLKQIKAAGGESLFVKCDVSNVADVKAMIDKTIATYGRLDFAYNNAGIEGETAHTNDCTEENWDKTININLKGVWSCMKHEIIQMRKQGSGAIVNCASVAGLNGFIGLPAYVASKHGIVGLTKTAALENATLGIRVNAVCPGVIHTAMIDRVTGKDKEVEKQFTAMEPVGRMGLPEEVAEAVVWLCSDASSFVTGTAIAIDGGFSAA
jgi:NAD(P)-dependent dehydrogenase (short-subunit alcohol dehydrogenase family)